MITSMLTLNAILMLSVAVSIVALLAWAIRTQHRDHATQIAATDPVARPAGRRSRPAPQPRRRPVTGGV